MSSVVPESPMHDRDSFVEALGTAMFLDRALDSLRTAICLRHRPERIEMWAGEVRWQAAQVADEVREELERIETRERQDSLRGAVGLPRWEASA